MKAFLNHLSIQLKLDMRNKSLLLVFYIIPLVFYLVMGAVFSSIMSDTNQTLGAALTIFAITMGAVLGIPPVLVTMRESGSLRAYRVSGVPGWSVLLTVSASAFINLLIVSVIICVTAPLLYGAGVPASIGGYIVTLLLLILASIAVGVMAGVLSKSQSMAIIFSQAVFLPSLMLSGIMFPAELLPEPLQWAGRIFPATHTMRSFTDWAFGNNGFPAAANGIIAGIGLIAVVIALWRFRKISTAA